MLVSSVSVIATSASAIDTGPPPSVKLPVEVSTRGAAAVIGVEVERWRVVERRNRHGDRRLSQHCSVTRRPSLTLNGRSCDRHHRRSDHWQLSYVDLVQLQGLIISKRLHEPRRQHWQFRKTLKWIAFRLMGSDPRTDRERHLQTLPTRQSCRTTQLGRSCPRSAGDRWQTSPVGDPSPASGRCRNISTVDDPTPSPAHA